MATQIFNFGDVVTTSAVNSSSALKPWNIYEGKFEGLERTELQGKKDPNSKYDTIKFSFSCDEGSFTSSIFVPSKEENFVRQVYTNKDGHEYERPSHFEEFKWTILQIASVVNPTGYEKLKTQVVKCKTIDDFIKLVLAVANAKKGATVKLKLTGRESNGSVFAQLPRVCGVDRQGNCFVANTFIGNNVYFSDYEERKAAEYANRKPTKNVEDLLKTDESDQNVTAGITQSNAADEDDIDFEGLLND